MMRTFAHFSIREKKIGVHVITQVGFLSFELRVHQQTRLESVVLLRHRSLGLHFLDLESQQTGEVRLLSLKRLRRHPQQTRALGTLELVHRVPLMEDHF